MPSSFVTTKSAAGCTVTVFVAQLLFESLISEITPFGSTAHVPPLFGFDREPTTVGVTVIGMLADPPGGKLTVPFALQVKILLAMEQSIVPVVPPAMVTAPTAYVAPEVGKSSVKMI